STGYGTNNGLVKKTSHDRYNLSAKIDITPNDRLSIGLNTDLAAQTSKEPSVGEDLFKYAYFANPYERPYNSDGSYRGDRTFYSLKEHNGGGYDRNTPPNGYNILREIDETYSKTDNYSGSITANVGYKIIDLLRFSGIASYSYTNNQSDNINGPYSAKAFNDRLYFDNHTSKRQYGSITQTSSSNSSYMLRGQFEIGNFLKGKHYISALAGSEIRSQKGKSIFAKRYGYDEVTGNSAIPVPFPPAGDGSKIDYNDLISYAAMVDGLSGQTRVEDAFASFYASADYSYDRKYTLSLTGRTDGSNNFGSNQQFNPTWSAGVAWNIDQEDFFESISSVFSRLSLKAATGYTGNINRTVYPQLIMDYLTTFRKSENDYYRMGRIANAPNRNLRWEKTQDYKIALDFGLFKNRITGLVEYYQRNSRDLVTNLRVTSSTGFNSQKFNTSSVENSGLELTLGGTIIKKQDFSWSLSTNMAYNQNKLTKYNTSSGTISPTSNEQIGYPLNSIFTGKTLGIDPGTGIYRYALRPDATIESFADLRDANNYVFYLGTNTAPVTGGFSTSVQYKEWSIGLGGNFSLGNKILDEVNPPLSYNSLIEGKSSVTGTRESIPTSQNDLYINQFNITRDRANVWTEDTPIINGYPRLIDYFATPLGFDQTNPTASSITRASMLKNVSYLRFGSIHIGYNFKDSLLKKVRLSSAGLNFSATNLFTITNYDGIDPETPGAVYPLTRSFSFGLNIGF
ncbi:MAG: TonB-dependent receptor, partial [Sphingobacterium sp.]|nr:TonB-dependent receptor [Sphingobacterium sp.]